MAARNDVETITLPAVVLVRCTVCKTVHAAVPFGQVAGDQSGFQHLVEKLADGHKGKCGISVVPRCRAGCPASGCTGFCILDAGHAQSQGHWCNNSHQW